MTGLKVNGSLTFTYNLIQFSLAMSALVVTLSDSHSLFTISESEAEYCLKVAR